MSTSETTSKLGMGSDVPPLTVAALPGSVPEWPKGAGCKPAGTAYGGSNPPRPTGGGSVVAVGQVSGCDHGVSGRSMRSPSRVRSIRSLKKHTRSRIRGHSMTGSGYVQAMSRWSRSPTCTDQYEAVPL